MPLMQWSPLYDLGCAPMDATHREFMDLLNVLAEAEDSDFLAAFDAFYEHTVAHFEQENVWMKASGFPPIHCHMDEHNRVLATLRSLRGMVSRGDMAIGRRAAEEMVSWFGNHAATMDTALSVYIRNVGYVPEALASEA